MEKKIFISILFFISKDFAMQNLRNSARRLVNTSRYNMSNITKENNLPVAVAEEDLSLWQMLKRDWKKRRGSILEEMYGKDGYIKAEEIVKSLEKYEQKAIKKLEANQYKDQMAREKELSDIYTSKKLRAKLEKGNKILEELSPEKKMEEYNKRNKIFEKDNYLSRLHEEYSDI